MADIFPLPSSNGHLGSQNPQLFESKKSARPNLSTFVAHHVDKTPIESFP